MYSSCNEAPADAGLVGTYWALQPAGSPPKDGREVHLVLGAERAQVSGFAGCNRFAGSYAVEGADRIHFTGLTSSQAACREGGNQEEAFLRALQQVAYWHIDGDALDLQDDRRNSVLRLESRSATKRNRDGK